MYIGQMSTPGTLLNRVAPKRLLVIGPQGTTTATGDATVQLFLAQVAQRRDLQVDQIDSGLLSLGHLSQRGLFYWKTLPYSLSLLWHYLRKIIHCDAVLLFASTPFVLAFAFPLIGLARLWGKRFLIKLTDSKFDLVLAAQRTERQGALIRLLNHTAGVLVQTMQLQQALTQWGIHNTFYVPGWQPQSIRPTVLPKATQLTALRLLFFAEIKREQGPYVLLHALQQMAYHSHYPISCDFYGPIAPEERLAFMAELQQTPQAQYRGLLEPAQIGPVMTQYDALVLPTYCAGEGHPTIILEAMMAGLPVISTNHRAIPELIQSGVNGLLAPVKDSTALKDAIIELAQNPPLRQRMAAASYNKAQAFRADQVVPQLLQLIFPEQSLSAP